MISTPASDSPASSSNRSSPCPPPNRWINASVNPAVDRVECFPELPATHGVDLFDRLSGVADGIQQILPLRGQEHETFFGFLMFFNSHHVDGAHRVHLFANLTIFLLADLQFFRQAESRNISGTRTRWFRSAR